jgi:hypothetical protein
MSGADVPTVRTLAIAAATTAAILIAAPVSSAAKPGWAMTHKISIEGEFVNHWTFSDNQDCGPVGEGTLTVKFHTTVATRVKPYLDTYRGGGWNVAIPYGYKGHLLRGMESAKAAGTITRVDNTTPKPSAFEDEVCPPLSRTGCGTFPLKTSAFVDGGHRPTRIAVHAGIGFESNGECLIGDASTFDATQAVVGGNREGHVMVKMPKPSALKRRVVRLTGKTHKRSTFDDPGAATSTNDVTRKVTVTFKRL